MTGPSQQHPGRGNVHVHHAQGLVVRELMGLDCPHHDNHMPLYQLVPGSQSRKPLSSSSAKGGRSTPTLPFPLTGAQLWSLLFVSIRPHLYAAIGRSLFAYLNLFYKASLSPSSHLSPHHSLLSKPVRSPLWNCSCFPDSRQVHVSSEIILHPRHRRGGGGAWDRSFSLLLEI